MTNGKSMDEGELSRMTLEYFANPTYQNELVQRGPSAHDGRRRDARFYRKRISELTKRLLRGETAGEELQSAYNAYVDTAIAHFKMLDRKDILQGEYEGLSGSTEAPSNLQEGGDVLREANSELTRPRPATSTLDSFVVSSRERTRQSEAPRIRSIDLRDPRLRTKGLKPRKPRSSSSKGPARDEDERDRRE